MKNVRIPPNNKRYNPDLFGPIPCAAINPKWHLGRDAPESVRNPRAHAPSLLGFVVR